MAKSLLAGKLSKDKVQTPSLTPEQVEAMHQAMTSVPNQTTTKVVEPKPTITKVTKEKEKNITKITSNNKIDSDKISTQNTVSEAITRLSIDVPKDIHKKMKIRVIDTEQSIRDYVVTLIKKDLGI